MNSIPLSKVIKCRFESPTKKKLDMLNNEWSRYQDFIELEKNDCIKNPFKILTTIKYMQKYMSD